MENRFTYSKLTPELLTKMLNQLQETKPANEVKIVEVVDLGNGFYKFGNSIIGSKMLEQIDIELRKQMKSYGN